MQELKVVLLAIRLAFINCIFGISTRHLKHIYTYKLNSGKLYIFHLNDSILYSVHYVGPAGIYLCMFKLLSCFWNFVFSLQKTSSQIDWLSWFLLWLPLLSDSDKCKITIVELNAFRFVSTKSKCLISFLVMVHVFIHCLNHFTWCAQCTQMNIHFLLGQKLFI